ncbi:hypothetical protein JCM19235_746 [Vibrio maritimus]|uniref:2-octaprenyl-3-methyl-6-methoxy-1,4-benzoquinol hydroxylase n=1 Tax=Vibrio maritimus TaxID=990268 RepID=A0A090RVC4_9VIBR|nr:hypothetical protein JCM19235_746 [Vibrio maritimus]
MQSFDIAIVGGGMVGLALARASKTPEFESLLWKALNLPKI